MCQNLKRFCNVNNNSQLMHNVFLYDFFFSLILMARLAA